MSRFICYCRYKECNEEIVAEAVNPAEAKAMLDQKFTEHNQEKHKKHV